MAVDVARLPVLAEVCQQATLGKGKEWQSSVVYSEEIETVGRETGLPLALPQQVSGGEKCH